MASARPAPAAPAGMQAQAERMARNFAEFEHYQKRAQGYLEQGELATAAAHCAIASHIATQNHCGVFWSPRLEKILTEIGRRIETPGPPRARAREIKRILHVSTQVSAVGGHTKLLCEWVKADAGREHTLLLTQHRGPTPDFVHPLFKASGGRRVEQLNHAPGGQLDWAKRLRAIASEFDVVVTHTHCEDVVPVIAFAETERHPPVVVLNHADHLFWFGPSICHLSINLRDAAQELAIARRSIAPERNALMPTLAEKIVRTRSREAAKRELGIAADTIVMTSAARRSKYRTMHGVTFADIHAPILEKHPNAMLLVVGPGEPEDWAPVRERFGAQLRSLPEQPDPRVYFEAADIYLDSYPFVSSTSLMEAAGYGAPAVTIFPHPHEARIFGINHFGLVGATMQAASFEDYRATVSNLIADPELRKRLGEASREGVAREHNLPGWKRWLEAAYAKAVELPTLDNRPMLEAVETPHFGDPDIRHEDIFGGTWPTVRNVMSYMCMLPMRQHLAHWNEVRAQGEFKSASEAAMYLLPEWFKRWVKDGLLKLPED